jgi:hypothetical protein
VALRYERRLYKEDDDGWQPELTTTSQTLDSCAIVYPSWFCEKTGRAEWRGLASQALVVQARCAPTTFSVCGNGTARQTVQIRLLGATVTLDDPSSPTLTTPSGSAWTATGWMSGTVRATIGASDNTGVKAVKAWVDGSVRGSADRACDFTLRVPCTDEPGAEVSVDTTVLSDGSHRLELGALDAANNEARVARPADLLVDNHAPASPQALTAPGGTTRATNDFELSWMLPAADGGSPVVRSRYSVCRLSTWQCTSGSRTDDLTHLHLTLPATGPHEVRVWLEDAAGQTDPDKAAGTTLNYNPPSTEPAAVPVPPATVDPQAPAGPPPSGGGEAALVPALAPPSIAPKSTLARADPKLRSIRARRTGRRVAVTGRISALASGRVTVTYERSIAGHILRVTKTAPIRSGRFAATVVLPGALARASRGRVTVRYAGDADTRPVARRLTVKR